MANKWEKREGSRGHPRAAIDREQFEKLCALQCTRKEIQFFFNNVAERTINGWCRRTYGKTFRDVYEEFAVHGKITLRRYQMQLAKKSSAMAIFLGKNMLGQTDKIEQTQNINAEVPMVQVYLPDNGRDGK